MRALTQCKLAGTRSFRLATAQLFGFGVNSQNSDKDTIDIYEAPQGYSIVQPDQSGAEALVVAHLAEDGKYRELFREGVKPHTYVALHLFLDKFRRTFPRDRYWLERPGILKNLPEWPQLKKWIEKESKFEYDIGKKTGHAKNYRMGPRTFMDSTLKESEGSLILTYDQAKYYLDTYGLLFPEVIVWQMKIEAMVMSDRKLANLFGFPRAFERNFTDSYIREAISWIPQSTVGTITHNAYYETYKHIKLYNLPWRLFNNKHDSYAALVPDASAMECAKVMRNHMAQTMVGWDGKEFTMRSEVQIGKNMKKYDREKNPLGLQEVTLTE